MHKYLCLLMTLIFAVPGLGIAQGEAGSSTGTATAPDVPVSTGTVPGVRQPTAQDVREIDSALTDLNYKIEYLRSRYDELGQELQKLQNEQKQQKRELAAQGSEGRQDPEKLKDLSAELELVRTDLAQTREELQMLQSRGRKPQEEPDGEKNAWMRSPWISLGALGIAIIALFVP